ncbi:MAG: hypothetical protein E7166_01410 [Firmicutes bacterium]|nr:hypothetical protein [Bacillota bacterium]
MDSNTKLILLYDYYGELLTDKQKIYFEDYYFNNLTLSEISENNSVSRSAVQKQLKDIEDKLTNYEQKLQIIKRNKQIEKLLNKIDDSKLKNEISKLL